MDLHIQESVEIVKRWGEPTDELIRWSGLCVDCGSLPGTYWNSERALLASYLHQEHHHSTNTGGPHG